MGSDRSLNITAEDSSGGGRSIFRGLSISVVCPVPFVFH